DYKPRSPGRLPDSRQTLLWRHPEKIRRRSQGEWSRLTAGLQSKWSLWLRRDQLSAARYPGTQLDMRGEPADWGRRGRWKDSRHRQFARGRACLGREWNRSREFATVFRPEALSPNKRSR